MASINDLDNPLLVLILNRLCIQKLFTAGHVCVRWNAIRGLSASDRKELVLMIGNDAQRYIDESGFQIPENQLLVDDNGDVMFPDNQSDVQLQIHSFPLEFSCILTAHFGKLTSLTISIGVNGKELDSIIHLLEQFSRPDGTLQSLKLYSNQDNESNTELIKKQSICPYLHLLSTVNSIGSLRKLTFDVNTKLIRNVRYPRINLPILAQLEQFEFNSADSFACLCDSIKEYAVNNPRLKRIGINYSNLCLHFPNLTSLKMTVCLSWRYTITTLLHPLTHLPNLISLVLKVQSGEILRVPYRDTREIQFELPSVKVLTINYTDWNENHHFFDKCNMNLVLPNVQVVLIVRERSLCQACQTKYFAEPETLTQLEEHCARQMFRHFVHCRHLKMVCSKVAGINGQLHNISYRQWTWNEMEPFEDEDEKEEPENKEKGTCDDPILIDGNSEEEKE